MKLELCEVKEEVSSLKAEVERLRRSFAGLRATGGVPPPQSPARDSSYAASEDSFSVVSERRPAGGVRGLGSKPPCPPSPITSEHSGPIYSAGSQEISWARRDEIATNLGLWVARAVRGEHRGPSGRDKNPLSSRVWVTVRDFEGLIYDPPLIHRTWQGCKVLCKRGSEAGDAVFFGLPTQQEAQRAIEAAGLTWSGILQPWVLRLPAFCLLRIALWLRKAEYHWITLRVFCKLLRDLRRSQFEWWWLLSWKVATWCASPALLGIKRLTREFCLVARSSVLRPWTLLLVWKTIERR